MVTDPIWPGLSLWNEHSPNVAAHGVSFGILEAFVDEKEVVGREERHGRRRKEKFGEVAGSHRGTPAPRACRVHLVCAQLELRLRGAGGLCPEALEEGVDLQDLGG